MSDREHSTLHKVTGGDFLTFKRCLETFMDWYRSECDRIREMSEAWIESEEDTLLSILSCGLTELQTQTEIVKEADRIDRH